MIGALLGRVYGAAAAERRQWYARHPSRVRRLARPVVSVGNLRVGGSGKTPVTAYIARLLVRQGERPAILSRGYRRANPQNGVTVVSDTTGVRADVDTAGDEPLMLARELPGVPVLVATERARAGQMAEERYGATVHILDDGFQHLQLARDIDLLLIAEADLAELVLPGGLLRESIDTASVADAVLVSDPDDAAAARVVEQLGPREAFQVVRAFRAPRTLLDNTETSIGGTRVLAVSGIARPERFVHDLSGAGVIVAGSMAFPDHHRYTRGDIDRILETARQASADLIVTTHKDAVRLERFSWTEIPAVYLPLDVRVTPEARFSDWLLERLRACR
ncbi:MAG: tetraacyldisaccharide 4'-kinase [Acidobacteriaceae bacterium]|nr:tetraacyldisaccharide 4'-kinase [Acidobacteriaceae bacterium]